MATDDEPVMVKIMDGWAAVGHGWAVFATLEGDARYKYAEAQKLHAEIAARDYPNVWSDDLPPGGYVCGECGQPTESEPCAEHQPLAAAGGEPARLADDPSLDGTDGAHPAWWRGDDHGYRRGRTSPWFCAECGYALLDEPNWQTHQEWHRRERVRGEYAAADAEIEAQIQAEVAGRTLEERIRDTAL
jgi:hypothetical protein